MDVPHGLPPDASEFSLNDRFRATFVRYAQLAHGDFEEAGKAFGRSWRHFKRYLKGGTNIPTEVLAGLAQKSGVSLEWIVTGRGAGRADPDIEPIRMLSIRPSAGGGSYISEENSQIVPMPRLLIAGLGLRADYARLLHAYGSSMSPTIEDGDWLLVATASIFKEDVHDGLIYVFTAGDRIHVKRLRHSPKGWIMMSDNTPTFPAEELIEPSEHFQVFGRVVWAGRRL